jgi:hypothetical protein
MRAKKKSPKSVSFLRLDQPNTLAWLSSSQLARESAKVAGTLFSVKSTKPAALLLQEPLASEVHCTVEQRHRLDRMRHRREIPYVVGQARQAIPPHRPHRVAGRSQTASAPVARAKGSNPRNRRRSGAYALKTQIAALRHDARRRVTCDLRGALPFGAIVNLQATRGNVMKVAFRAVPTRTESRTRSHPAARRLTALG